MTPWFLGPSLCRLRPRRRVVPRFVDAFPSPPTTTTTSPLVGSISPSSRTYHASFSSSSSSSSSSSTSTSTSTSSPNPNPNPKPWQQHAYRWPVASLFMGGGIVLLSIGSSPSTRAKTTADDQDLHVDVEVGDGADPVSIAPGEANRKNEHLTNQQIHPPKRTWWRYFASYLGGPASSSSSSSSSSSYYPSLSRTVRSVAESKSAESAWWRGDKYRVAFVLGGPGAGKGTNCEKLAAELSEKGEGGTTGGEMVYITRRYYIYSSCGGKKSYHHTYSKYYPRCLGLSTP